MPVETQESTKQGLGVRLEGKDTILFKFYFSDRALVPDGIPEKDSHDHIWKQQADQRHEDEAVAKGVQVINQRQGKVDTGIAVFGKNGINNVQVGMIRTGLTNNLFRLVDAHWFEKKAFLGKKTQYVVVLSFKKGAEEVLDLKKKTTYAIRALANMVWGQCHVWDNPNGTATINLTSRQQCAPKKALVTRDRVIVSEEVVKLVEEGGE